MNKIKGFIIYASVAVVVYLCVCWMQGYGSVEGTVWTEMASFYLTTFAILKWNREKNHLPEGMSVLGVWVGSVILPGLVKIFCWDSTPVVPILLIAITIGVLLGWLCYTKNKICYYILSLILAIAYNSVIVEIWMQYIKQN